MGDYAIAHLDMMTIATTMTPWVKMTSADAKCLEGVHPTQLASYHSYHVYKEIYIYRERARACPRHLDYVMPASPPFPNLAMLRHKLLRNSAADTNVNCG